MSRRLQRSKAQATPGHLPAPALRTHMRVPGGSAALRALASSPMCATRAGPCSGTPWGAFLGRLRGEGRSGAAALRFARAGFFPSAEEAGRVQRWGAA